MNIDSIVNGIVIDHITAGRAMRLYELLGLGEADCSVAIIKIDADLPINLDVIGYVDPQATVNIIRDGALAEKRIIGKPLRLTNVLRCKNPRCITSVEQELPHVFCLTDAENGVYRCLYCETKGTAPDGK